MRKNRRNSRNKDQKKSVPKLTSICLAVCVTTVSYAALVNGGEATAKAGITAMLASVYTVITEQYAKVMGVFNAQMAAMDVAVTTAYQIENEQVSSAFKVFVKQMSVSSNLLAENTVKVAQTEASIEQARMQKDRIIETNERLGSQGQGHKVCTVLNERKNASQVANTNAKNVPSLISDTVYAASGTYNNPHRVQVEMNLDHSMNYCTPEQAASGFCSAVTEKAGWDVQASTLFTPTTEGSDVFKAQNSLINNMVGLPDPALPEALKGSPTASNYLHMKQKKDAIISPAINSLKAIQAEYAGLSTSDSVSGVSPIRAIDEQVKRYLGSGDEYKSWNQTLVAGSESGIMKELLQVQALDLYLQARQYKQYEREELLLAGIVASTQNAVDAKSGGASSADVESKKQKLAARSITTQFYDAQGLGR